MIDGEMDEETHEKREGTSILAHRGENGRQPDSSFLSHTVS